MLLSLWCFSVFFFFQAEDGIRDYKVTGVQTCALPIYIGPVRRHCRQTGPIYLAKLLSPYLFLLRCGLRPWQAFVPLTTSNGQADPEGTPACPTYTLSFF